MCGVIAVLLADPDARACQLLYDGLTMLQHRGQDAAGIVTCEPESRSLHMRKANGLVKEVFETGHMQKLAGNMGIGHVRYPTAGSSSSSEAQPFYTNMPYGLCLAHNGNLVNDAAIATKLRDTSLRHLNTKSDSEALLNLFADELQQQVKRGEMVTAENVFASVKAVCGQCQGGYAVAVMINGVGIVAFRDPWGIRPLCLGRRASATADSAEGGVSDYVVASESVALDVLDFELESDINPGECVFIPCGPSPTPARQQCFESILSPCLFEFVYFARPDSVMDGVSVYKARLNMGVTLAARITEAWGADHGIDVVVPIPDTSRTSALALARALDVPYQEGLIKNRYIARTFIMPGQPIRRSAVRLKLNVIKSEIKDQNVLLVDDSIVRGTTATKIVELVRKAGAKSVSIVSAAPKVCYQNVYGIDMPAKEELVAHGRTDAEIAETLNVDRVLFQDLAALEQAVKVLNPSIDKFESSVFNGEYVTPGVDEAYLTMLSDRRTDAKKRKAAASTQSPLREVRASVGVFNALEISAAGGGGGGGAASSPPGSPDRLMRVPSNGEAEGMYNLRTVKEI